MDGNESAERSEDRQPGKRRRRRRSAKELYEKRRRWKKVAAWLIVGLVAGILVAVLAVFAGRGVNN
jgi:uncharacterized protein involved in exopolysaccharide biosynthesis